MMKKTFSVTRDKIDITKVIEIKIKDSFFNLFIMDYGQ